MTFNFPSDEFVSLRKLSFVSVMLKDLWSGWQTPGVAYVINNIK